MKGKWFGWVGLLCVCLFVSFLFFPDELDLFRFPVVAVTVIAAMLAGVILPLIAGVRGSKWWFLVSVVGALAAMMFFAIVQAN
jgi:hypothetical protein